jgi:4-cresol dehydrogenase (hydroxylating)
MNKLMENGYPPYRLGTQGMHFLESQSSKYRDFIGQLKQNIDPNQILSPGRYEVYKLTDK